MEERRTLIVAGARTEERRALIELLDRDGSVRTRHPVGAWPVRIGRAFDCDLVLDDPHVAAHHAELALDAEGHVIVTALPSVNGVQVGPRKISPSESDRLASGDLLRMGQSSLRLRHASEALAPERPLTALAGRRRMAGGLALGASVLLVTAGEAWLELDPGGKLASIFSALLAATAVLIAWAGLWSLVTKLFGQHVRFLAHLRLALWFALVATGADVLLHGLAFSLSWGLPSRLATWGQVACGFALVRAHLDLVVPALRRAVTRTALALFAASMAVSMALTWQRSDRLFGELYTATLGPPVLRLSRAVAPAALLDAARRLQASLEERAREDGDGEIVDD